MKFVILTVFFWLRIPVLHSIDMLDCALGRVDAKQCPQDGGWSQWSVWGVCEGECGGAGRQLRSRNCSNPPPQRNGADCDGDRLDLKPCSVPGCSLEQYQKLLEQDVVRQQQLANLKTSSGENSALLTKCLSSNCDWSDVSQALPSGQTSFWNSLLCVKKNIGCPAAGGWGDWSPWTRCSARCGSGEQMRCRVCCDPPTTCAGNSCQYQPCTGSDCGAPLSKGGEWSDWSAWSTCSAPCDFGFTRRTRVCQNPNQKSSNNGNPSLKGPGDSYNADDYVKPEEEYNYAYDYGDNEGNEDDNEETGDSYNYDGYNDLDDSYYTNRRFKRKAKCDKTEYYNNDDAEDLTQKTMKLTKPTSRKESKTTEPITVGQTVEKLETRPEEVNNDAKDTTQRTLEHTKPSSEKESITITESIDEQTEEKSKTRPVEASATSRSIDVNTKPSMKHASSSTEIESRTKLITFSSSLEQEDVTKPKKIQTKSDSSKGEFKGGDNYATSYTKRPKTTNRIKIKPSRPRTKGNRIKDPIQLDCEDEDCLELYQNSSSAPFCSKTNPNCVCIKTGGNKKSPQAAKNVTVTGLNQSPAPTIPLTSQSRNSVKPDVKTTKIVNIAVAVTPVVCKESVAVTLEPSTSPGLNKENHIEMESSFPVKTTEPSVLYSTVPPSSLLASADSISAGSTSSNSSQASNGFSTASSKNLLGTQNKTSTSLITNLTGQEGANTSNAGAGDLIEGSQRVGEQNMTQNKTSSTSPTTNLTGQEVTNTSNTGVEEIDGSQQVAEQNTSVVHPISCDLSKKLELPSFSDSFPSEGCGGAFEELKPCNTQYCNEAGGWSEWSSWSQCAPDCGLGWQVSARSCTNPEPRNGSAQGCPGEATRRQTCYLQPCPVTLRTSKAVFLTGESVVRYSATQRHTSMLLLYVRLRHFSPAGSVVTRRPRDCPGCDHVTLSLYQGHVLVSVLQQRCRGDFLTNQRLNVGEWHDVLLTVVGATVTLRLDDSATAHSLTLSCRPSAPNYDSDMTIGGSHFVGEVDRLIVNFKNYVFQKKKAKREAWTQTEDVVAPADSSQVQYEVSSRDSPLLSLSHLLQAPCFRNHSQWHVGLAIKPKFPDGLVLFIKGYDSRDFLFVSLEQTRIRLRVRAGGQMGECEQPVSVAPQSWLHLALSVAGGGPVGLSVNGGPHCVVSLAPPEASEQPTVYCTSGLLLGQMPARVKALLSAEGSAAPSHSPLGLLGHLTVDNHTLDLSRLPHKISPEPAAAARTDAEYRLASHTAASTVYYEEMLVLEGERLSMPCIYNLSPNNTSDATSLRDLGNNWYKLDIPVKSVFSNDSGVRYEIAATGKAVSLNITGYAAPAAVEGFYSCWLHYPLPLQSGLNIVTYGVVVVSITQDKRSWLFWLMTLHLGLTLVLLVSLVLTLVYEAYQDFKRGTGFYRSRKLKGDEAYAAAQLLILSDKGINRLGGLEAAEAAMERYAEWLEQEAAAEVQPETDIATDMATDDEAITDDETSQTPKKISREERKTTDSDVFHSLPETNIHIGLPKRISQKVTVGMVGVEFTSPFQRENGCSPLRDESRITIEDLMQSDTEENAANKSDNLIDVSEQWTQKEVKSLASRETNATGIGLIQNTSAYRSIENELKFKPDKFKNLEKYVYSKQNINHT